MSQFSFSTFQAKHDPAMAGKHISLVDRLCQTDEGDNLYNPNLLDWVENDVTCYVACDAESGQFLAGAAVWADTDSAKLTAVVTDPDARGQKLASQILEIVVDNCRARGIKSITLDIRLTDEGLPEAAYRLYRSYGFRLLPGVKVTPIKSTNSCRHLWRNPDPGGVFRSRVMDLDLSTDFTSARSQTKGRPDAA